MSASPQLSPDSTERKDPGERSTTAVLKVLGMEIPLPQWAISVIAVFVIVFLPVFLFFTLKHMRNDNNKEVANVQVSDALSKAKADLAAANKRLADTMAKAADAQDNYIEDTKHRGEAGQEYHRDKNLIITHYPSDGCVSVLRPGRGAPIWNKDPASIPAPPAAPGPVDGGVTNGILAPAHRPADTVAGKAASVGLGGSSADARLKLIDFKESIALPAPRTDLGAPQRASLNGRCLNPHPGKFDTSSGRVQGCWTQFWRKWPDGCTHYQWFNACSSTWDIDAAGHARVYWTACTH